MRVRVDNPGQHDAARRVDYVIYAISNQGWPGGRDLLARQQDIAAPFPLGEDERSVTD
jgi:hypothetical protein